MQNISAPSPALSVQDNPQTHTTDLEIVKLLQRAATGLSDALDVVLDLNPRSPAAAQLEQALGRGLRGVTALKRLRSMGSSGAATNTIAESKKQQATTLQSSDVQPTTAGLKKRRSRRYFDKDYKRWVVQLMRERNLTISEISKELNLTYSAVCRWVREFEPEQIASAQAGTGTAQQERIAALEELVQQLQAEKELLTKASAFFARELGNAGPVSIGR